MGSASANTIHAWNWTLFDKILYGGLGYGAFCLPADFFKVIVAIIFPPLGEIINIIEDYVDKEFPYFNWETLRILFSYQSINRIVYTLILTALFYIPGLVYTLTNIVNKERNVSYDISSMAAYGLTDPSRIIQEGGKYEFTDLKDDIEYAYYRSKNGCIYVYEKTGADKVILAFANTPAGVKYVVNRAGEIAVKTGEDIDKFFKNDLVNAGDSAISGIKSVAEDAIDAIGGLF
jgi:uncharacterized membrane protein YqaE (UPF0057 family)